FRLGEQRVLPARQAGQDCHALFGKWRRFYHSASLGMGDECVIDFRRGRETLELANQTQEARTGVRQERRADEPATHRAVRGPQPWRGSLAASAIEAERRVKIEPVLCQDKELWRD